MKIELAGKTALVTGAGNGIGQAIADALAQNGARVIYTDIDFPAARAAAARSEGCRALEMDITNPEQGGSAIGQTLLEYGSLDILVNDTVVRSVDESLVHAVDLVGSSDDDSFIIDYSNGNVESAGGVVIRGGTQQTTAGDSLTLQTGSFLTVTHRFESASSGSVQAESNAPIVYSELEPISDSLLSGDRVFVRRLQGFRDEGERRPRCLGPDECSHPGRRNR